MKIFSVGGSIRDELLGLPVHDLDYCVVGSTPEEMKSLGYFESGKDFPVFRDSNGDEFALARKERKTGVGYYGFQCDFNKEISIEEDLFRRDLTINAMAKDKDGNIIDPYGGIEDINSKLIRHVSDAFKEDPVRILRVARFHCRYSELGFTIANETMDLMKEMVDSGELNSVTPERILLEMEKACSEKTPSVFFNTLRECGALKVILPELNDLHGVPQPEKHHPEIDSLVHTLMVVDRARELTSNKEIIFASLLHDLGKGLTPKEQWPKHIMHEKNGVPLVNAVCTRLKMTNKTRKLALNVCEYHLKAHLMLEMNPSSILSAFEDIGGIKEPRSVENFMLACQADAQGRKGLKNAPYPQMDFVMSILPSVEKVDSLPLREKGYKGQELAYQIRQVRIKNLKSAIGHYHLEQKLDDDSSMQY